MLSKPLTSALFLTHWCKYAILSHSLKSTFVYFFNQAIRLMLLSYKPKEIEEKNVLQIFFLKKQKIKFTQPVILLLHII